MELMPGAKHRLESDHVVWLTTITDDGAPAPYPVWFVVDGEDVVVFSAPSARRVRNIAQRPRVSLNFNSDQFGGDVWVISGTAQLTSDVLPSSAPGYLAKYAESIERDLQTTVEAIDATYNTEIRIRIERVVTV
ncbi:MAG: TIGR03667 family PPOX class F420-dependent oxidoreductase [Actinobacteria bacterium]|nr:TIGR03667 family PPOX class F420-dependent oxidoreductase [Actinomycetota bacterium]